MKATAITWRIDHGPVEIFVTFQLRSLMIVVQWDSQGERKAVFLQGDKRDWRPRSEAFAKQAAAHAIESKQPNANGTKGTKGAKESREEEPVLDTHQRQLPIGDR